MDPDPSKSDSLPTRGSLLVAAMGHEPGAWRRLVSLYEPRMRWWCRVQGLDEMASSDVIQDAWISVARGMVSFRSEPGVGAFRAWLHRIVRRRIADYRRRWSPGEAAVGGSSFMVRMGEFPASEPELASGSSTMHRVSGLPGEQPHSGMDGIAAGAKLERVLEALQSSVEPTTWLAFWRCVIDQRTTDEVAKELGLTQANVRQCRSRILRKLRAAMENRGPSGDGARPVQ